MKITRRLLREPLLHFLAIGGLLFALYAAVSEPAPRPADELVVSPQRVEQLAAGFQRVWRRPPSDDEVRGLVADFVREEVFYREALALGLDQDDVVIRRRLRQKMEFLSDTGADMVTPADGELEAYLAANAEKYRVQPRLALEQVYLGQDPPPVRVDETLQALRADGSSDPSRWSDRTLLPPRVALSPPDAVDGIFGLGFFEQVAGLPVGQWSGPVESTFGVHLVRITRRTESRLPGLEEVRDAVLRDWKAEKSRELREELYARLRERYEVRLPETLERPEGAQ